METLIAYGLMIFVALLIGRAFGAWMLRINELIRHQKETNKLLKEIKEQNKNTYLREEND